MKWYLLVMMAVLTLDLFASVWKASGHKLEHPNQLASIGDVIVLTALLVWTITLLAS